MSILSALHPPSGPSPHHVVGTTRPDSGLSAVELASHRILPGGIELAVLSTAGRSLVAMEIRVLAGFAFESPSHLGVAHVLAEVLSKGTTRREGRELNDAFDEIGASHSVGAGRETITFSCLSLPRYLERAVSLHAEMIREPALPEDACRVAIELTRQAVASLDDDPGELAKKHLHERAYNEPLGRHLFGREDTLSRITRADVCSHWSRHITARRMQISIAGGVDPEGVADVVTRAFEGFGTDLRGDGANGIVPANLDRPALPLHVRSGQHHFDKPTEQEQIAFCFPGLSARDPDAIVEQVLVGALSGGMSSRLWTSVREKQGLVYWVGAWLDRPRDGGAVHIGASTTPENVEVTCATLVRELETLRDTLTENEIERAKTGILASVQTRGDLTRSRASRIANDLFFHGKPIALEEKLARVRAVTLDDVRQYLERSRRDDRCLVTLGPRPIGPAG